MLARAYDKKKKTFFSLQLIKGVTRKRRVVQSPVAVDTCFVIPTPG